MKEFYPRYSAQQRLPDFALLRPNSPLENFRYARDVRQCENNHAVKDMKLLKKSVRNLMVYKL